MKIALLTLSAIALAAAISPAAGAGKLTIDPNSTRAKAPAVGGLADKPDERLTQKITYLAVDRRLHQVLTDISKQTKVSIFCGKDPMDWQVRDLPVVVCVKDIALGKLLRSVADATHLALSSTTEKGLTRYRVWRDPARQKQLFDYLGKRTQAQAKLTGAEWDAWVKLGEMPDSKWPSGGSSDPNMLLNKAVAKVFAAIPAGVKEDVMAGKPARLRLKSADAKLASALRLLYNRAWDCQRAADVQWADKLGTQPGSFYASRFEMTDAAINMLEMSISQRKDKSGHLDITMPNCSIIYFYDSQMPKGDWAAKKLGEDTKLPSLPEPPETDYAPYLSELDLSKAKDLGLDSKFRMDKPEGDDISFADVACMVAEKSGCSIIAEDFVSHTRWEVPDIYGRDLTLAGLLRSKGVLADQPSELENVFAAICWHIDPTSKLLVGSKSDWYDFHVNLVAERTISHLVEQANGSGVGLDDAVAMLLLTPEQKSQWLYSHRYLGSVSYGRMAKRSELFWKLYAGLSEREKAMARSDDGLSLGLLKRELVVPAFQECAQYMKGVYGEERAEAMETAVVINRELAKRLEQWLVDANPGFEEMNMGHAPLTIDIDDMLTRAEEAFPELKSAMQTPTDPSEISKLRMYVKEADPSTGAIGRSWHYSMSMEGEGVNMQIGWFPRTFPIYSEKRVHELELESSKKNEAGGNAGSGAPQ